MARMKAVARQYLRPGNHTRARSLCTVEGCSHRPINRVYFNTASLATATQLLCPTHVLNYLDAPSNTLHVRAINNRYRPNDNWALAYSAE